MSKNIIIGIGNLLFSDDGVGVFTAHYLQRNFSFTPEVEILDGGTLGFNLLEYFLEYENVFIVDSISLDDVPGSIYKIPSEELLGGGRYKSTAHEIEVLEMLEAASLYEKRAKVTVFGIVPKDIEKTNIGLSPEIVDKFALFVETVIEELGRLDVRVRRKKDISLEKIIKELRRE